MSLWMKLQEPTHVISPAFQDVPPNFTILNSYLLQYLILICKKERKHHQHVDFIRKKKIEMQLLKWHLILIAPNPNYPTEWKQYLLQFLSNKIFYHVLKSSFKGNCMSLYSKLHWSECICTSPVHPTTKFFIKII